MSDKPAMTERQIKAFVEKTVKQLAKIFGLDFYEIKIRYRYEKDTKGSCYTMTEYEEAVVNINLEEAKTLLDLRKTILHEMAHIVGWDIYHVGFDLARSVDDSKFAKRRVTKECERVTTAWTRILEPLVFDR